MELIHALRQGISFLLTDRTARRITLHLLPAVVSEYILTDLDLQTTSLFKKLRTHCSLLFWIVYNVVLMVASLWSRQGAALLYLLDALPIWLFCIFSFGVLPGDRC